MSTTLEEQGAALQAAVDRLLPAIQALGPVGRPVLVEGMRRATRVVMADADNEWSCLPGAVVIDSFCDVILAVDALAGDL